MSTILSAFNTIKSTTVSLLLQQQSSASTTTITANAISATTTTTKTTISTLLQLLLLLLLTNLFTLFTEGRSISTIFRYNTAKGRQREAYTNLLSFFYSVGTPPGPPL